MLLLNLFIIALSFLTVAEASFNIFRRIPKAILGKRRKVCEVRPGLSPDIDDAPAIIKAFEDCNTDAGLVVFSNRTYYINSVMNTTGLMGVGVDIKGTLKWSKNTEYWLKNSLPVGYQNQSTAWYLGGDKLHIRGFGYGTIDGNGQTWYDLVKGQSNYPRRPHGVTFRGLTNSRVEGLRFVQSQMWTMSIIYSKNVVFDKIFISSRSTSGQPARNTDGADTIYSSRLTFSNWEVHNGDDCISFKANSTDMVVTDARFHEGLGIAFGSIGQYLKKYETIERVKISNIHYSKTRYAIYFKTWTGEQVDYPPNGGGGGLGFASDISATNLTLSQVQQYAFGIGQCTSFSGTQGNCSSSLFQIRNVKISDMKGTIGSSKVADMRCAYVTCPFITIRDVDLRNTTTGVQANGYLCRNVRNMTGFVCNQ